MYNFIIIKYSTQKNINYITLQDVLSSTYSDTVLSLLIDAKAFYLHDQKENQVIIINISMLMSLKILKTNFFNLLNLFFIFI